jgi:hypothetical protein
MPSARSASWLKSRSKRHRSAFSGTRHSGEHHADRIDHAVGREACDDAKRAAGQARTERHTAERRQRLSGFYGVPTSLEPDVAVELQAVDRRVGFDLKVETISFARD